MSLGDERRSELKKTRLPRDDAIFHLHVSAPPRCVAQPYPWRPSNAVSWRFLQTFGRFFLPSDDIIDHRKREENQSQREREIKETGRGIKETGRGIKET